MKEITVTKDAARERALKFAERKWLFVGMQFYRVHEWELKKNEMLAGKIRAGPCYKRERLAIFTASLVTTLFLDR